MPQAGIALLTAATVLVTVAALLLLELRRGRAARAELERAGNRELVGRHIIVNTRKPDDQSIRGWVRTAYDDGTLELAQAFYLEPSGDGHVTPVLIGDALIPAHNVGWLQLDVPVPSPPPED